MTELIRPTIYGNLEEVKRLVSEGADVNAKDSIGYTILHFAACCGHLNVIEFVLNETNFNKGINCKNMYGCTALDYAYGHYKHVVSYLKMKIHEERCNKFKEELIAVCSHPNGKWFAQEMDYYENVKPLKHILNQVVF